MEQIFVLLKPDAVQRGLLGQITSRLEEKGLQLQAAKFMTLSDAMLDEHYAHLKDKPFFPSTKAFMKSAPVLAMVWAGKDAVAVVRKLAGVTNSRLAEPGTIRGDFGQSVQCNLIHASDSVETAQKEVGRFFKKGEIFEHADALTEYTYSSDERA